MNLTYETMEKLSVPQPVDRLDFIADDCVGKAILDIGCFDETALIKRETKYWLHGRIVSVAKSVVGVDNSSKIPAAGLRTGSNAIIFKGDGVNLDKSLLDKQVYELIVAGEFIEHIENPLEFFREIKRNFSGRELVISTPNGVSFANTLLGFIRREVQHPDHLHNFTFKVLNTLCLRAGFKSWEIIPYRFFATEMIMNSKGAKRILVMFVERMIRLVERVFPLLSFGYILRVNI